MKKNPLLDVVHEDEFIVVVNKSAGLLAIPDRFDATLPSVRSLVMERYEAAFIVHRLDRDTTGLMVVARTAEAHKHLNDQFQNHRVNKLYHAIVGGVVDKDEVPIDIPITQDVKRKGLMKPSARGKEAHTVLRTLERFRVATLVECRLITGRQHQIRVHCAAIGFPLLVDPDYGKNADFKLSAIKRKFHLAKDTEERPIMSRLTLHAAQLGFVHPGTLAPVLYTAEYPKDFAATLQVLRKYAAPYASAFDFDF
ncbi:MAG: RluA family pseudouridine synthase [bacterium]|nr:RluA family pseudouridine synthase [bacterium]